MLRHFELNGPKKRGHGCWEGKKVKIYQCLAATACSESLWLGPKLSCGCSWVLTAVPPLVPLQDAAGQPLVPRDQSAPAKPHTSDMDKLGQSPGTQPGSQAGHPAMESIIRNLSELQGQMSSMQSLARDLQGEKEKVSP